MRILVLIFVLIGVKGYANEHQCLALNIYHEAKNQSMVGQVAVGQVVMNRVYSKYFPNSICDVVKQGLRYNNGKIMLHKCQFSWFCDGKSDDVAEDSIQWLRAKEYARLVMSGRIVFDVTEGAEFYHATYVLPSWHHEKTRTVRIGRHIFYKWKHKK